MTTREIAANRRRSERAFHVATVERRSFSDIGCRRTYTYGLFGWDMTDAVAPLVWQCRSVSGVTCGAQHLHVPSGMVVIHCGHPTANFPYYIQTPRGASIFAPNGRGFQRLALAKEHVERLWEGRNNAEISR